MVDGTFATTITNYIEDGNGDCALNLKYILQYSHTFKSKLKQPKNTTYKYE